MSRIAGLKRHVRFFFFLLSIYFTINYYLCSHYASPLCITTTHHHYISPLRIATTHCRYNCNITHWQEKAQDSKHDHPKRLSKVFVFILLIILRCSPHLKRLLLNLFYAHQCARSQIPHPLTSTPSMETMTDAKPCTMYVSSSL